MHNAKCTTIGLLGQTLILAQGPFEDYWTFNIKNFLGVIFVFSCKKYKLPVRTSVIVNQLTREGTYYRILSCIGILLLIINYHKKLQK